MDQNLNHLAELSCCPGRSQYAPITLHPEYCSQLKHVRRFQVSSPQHSTKLQVFSRAPKAIQFVNPLASHNEACLDLPFQWVAICFSQVTLSLDYFVFLLRGMTFCYLDGASSTGKVYCLSVVDCYLSSMVLLFLFKFQSMNMTYLG
jgi:hypothetical protein